MHYSQSHGYNDDGGGTWTPLGTTGPYEYLLRNEVNELCLSCHEGQTFAPDVLGPNTNTNVRQAGALNEPGKAYNTTDGHTLGSTDVAPGSDPAWNNPDGLNCADCHNPHGYNPNGNPYRNLAHDPGNYSFGTVLVTYAVGTNDLTKDVYETAAAAYDVSNVWFNEPDETKSAYADFCKGCHTKFHGAKADANMGGATGEEWLRHPTADANIGALGGGHSSRDVYASKTNKVKVMNATGVWESSNPDDFVHATPSCMTCHKAHGNQNAFGLIYMSGTGTITEEGDTDGTQARDLCKQCHVQGG
jgi:cytochrome c553